MATEKSWSILKADGPKLKLWDGPRLHRTEALKTIKQRRKERPKDVFFLYVTEWYYDRGIATHKRGDKKGLIEILRYFVYPAQKRSDRWISGRSLYDALMQWGGSRRKP